MAVVRPPPTQADVQARQRALGDGVARTVHGDAFEHHHRQREHAQFERQRQ